MNRVSEKRVVEDEDDRSMKTADMTSPDKSDNAERSHGKDGGREHRHELPDSSSLEGHVVLIAGTLEPSSP